MSIITKKIKPEFTDQRGYISRIIDQNKIVIRSILVIFSKTGSVRGKHYHVKDSHFVYCLSGKFKYSEKNMRGENSKVVSVLLKPGTLVFTKPMVWHSMEFLEDSVFFAFTTETRDQKKYESDTVRLDNV